MTDGDPMLIPCVGGPAAFRTATFPPSPEVEVEGGLYALVDDGPPERWRYEFVGHRR